MKGTYVQICGIAPATPTAASAEAEAASKTASEASPTYDSTGSPSPRALSKSQLDALSKTDLTASLREALRYCFLCTQDCECLAQGVGCSADTCACPRKEIFRGLGEGTGAHSALPNQTCGNPVGRQVFDQEAVNLYRKRVLACLHNGVVSYSRFDSYKG